MQEITDAVIDGSKAGAAYAIAADITELFLSKTDARSSLPAFFTSGAGAKLLPVLLCYAIAFATVLIPGIPKADTIRKIATFAAKGAAAVAVAEWMPSIKTLIPQILGLAELHDLKVNA